MVFLPAHYWLNPPLDQKVHSGYYQKGPVRMANIASKGNGTWGIMADMPLKPAPTLEVCCLWYPRNLD